MDDRKKAHIIIEVGVSISVLDLFGKYFFLLPKVPQFDNAHCDIARTDIKSKGLCHPERSRRVIFRRGLLSPF